MKDEPGVEDCAGLVQNRREVGPAPLDGFQGQGDALLSLVPGRRPLGLRADVANVALGWKATPPGGEQPIFVLRPQAAWAQLIARLFVL
jgi:hypothetical protein